MISSILFFKQILFFLISFICNIFIIVERLMRTNPLERWDFSMFPIVSRIQIDFLFSYKHKINF